MESPPRSIVHLDLDAFFVSVERRKDSRLKGVPLIIGGQSQRAVVSSCSYEARYFGVHAGMPMRLARRLCPHAVVLKGDYDAYEQCSREVTEMVEAQSPLFEKASIDEFYIDLTGMERFYGCYRWAHELRQQIIHETHLPLSMGLSVNKLVAKVLTNQAKPNGERQLRAEEVQPFLAPLHVRHIPMIGQKTSHRLSYLGIRNVATLRQIPQQVLSTVFGKQGQFLYQSARGEDHRPVLPYRARSSLSSERTFQQDTMDIQLLRTCLTRMAEKLAYRLRRSGKLTGCISVKIRYASFETHSRQARIPLCNTDDVLIAKALQLFEQLYTRRIRIRLIGLKFSQLQAGGQQIALFQDIPRQGRLYQALDTIRDKYGTRSVQRASGWKGPPASALMHNKK
ncbi:MAG: DNA polymerase IV [Bacteroidetes bacterium]|nr:MAG: DNA polymerase IV [Bacteroidota bacterium]